MSSAKALSNLSNRYGSADWANWTKNRFTFYDYVRYTTAGMTEMQFFVQPNGSTDTYASSIKTLEHTNCPEARSFGKVGFLIHQIRTHIRVVPKARQPTGISDNANTIMKWYGPLMNKLADLVNMGTLQISIGQKEYFDLPQPFITCPPGFGPTIYRSGQYNTAATQTLFFQQSRKAANVYDVTPQQLVEPGQTFSAKITFDNATSPAITTLVNATSPYLEIGLIFDGYILRPMQ